MFFLREKMKNPVFYDLLCLFDHIICSFSAILTVGGSPLEWEITLHKIDNSVKCCKKITVHFKSSCKSILNWVRLIVRTINLTLLRKRFF